MSGGVVKEGDVEKLKFQKGREQNREGLGRARRHLDRPVTAQPRRVPSAEKTGTRGGRRRFACACQPAR
jgi:hypothetical protein